MTIPSREELDRLEQYVAAISNLVEMKDDLAECLETLREIQGMKLPTAEEAQRAADHRDTLEAIQEMAEV